MEKPNSYYILMHTVIKIYLMGGNYALFGEEIAQVK